MTKTTNVGSGRPSTLIEEIHMTSANAMGFARDIHPNGVLQGPAVSDSSAVMRLSRGSSVMTTLITQNLESVKNLDSEG